MKPEALQKLMRHKSYLTTLGYEKPTTDPADGEVKEGKNPEDTSRENPKDLGDGK